MLDGSWGLLKKYLPRQLVTKKEHVVNVQKFQNCILVYGHGLGVTTRKTKALRRRLKDVPQIQVNAQIRTSRSQKSS